MTAYKNIAIIGGGTVGPLLLAYISNEAKQNSTTLQGVTFHLIDPQGFGNGGIAYGQCHENHMLNSVIDEMSPFQKDAFRDFLEKEGLPAKDDEFYSRSLYQKFIQTDLVGKSVATLERYGARFKEHRVEALVEPCEGRFNIVDSKRNLIIPDLAGLSSTEIMITVGYGPNTNFEALSDYAGFIDNIYSSEGKALIEREPKLTQKEARVAVIGSGPGLYDVANEIDSSFPQFLVFSNAGKGLDVRDVALEYGEKNTVPQALLSLGKASSYEDAVNALIKDEFQLAAQGATPRRISLDIQKNLKEVLLQLDSGVAVAFKKSAEFEPIRHLSTPIPVSSKIALERLNPTFIKARLQEQQIEPQEDGSFKINVGNQSYIVDVIINATGHGRHNSPIIESLKEKGMARVSEATDSLETDNSGYRVLPSGLPIIGTATHVGCDGVESFAAYAEKCATFLIDDINNKRSYNKDLQGLSLNV